MYLVIGLLFGFIAGCIVMRVYLKAKTVGVLRHVRDDADVYMFLELHTPTDSVLNQKFITLEVAPDASSHK